MTGARIHFQTCVLLPLCPIHCCTNKVASRHVPTPKIQTLKIASSFTITSCHCCHQKWHNYVTEYWAPTNMNSELLLLSCQIPQQKYNNRFIIVLFKPYCPCSCPRSGSLSQMAKTWCAHLWQHVKHCARASGKSKIYLNLLMSAYPDYCPLSK